MQDTTNRTFICSVAFVDLVGYSKKLVSEQVQCKDRFNIAISEAIKNTPVADRIVLDTGDGAAISFLGDPEDALFVTLALRDSYAKLRADFPDDAIRMGINLGPVKLVKDINGQPNIIGDGINVAQRIMSFARPTQILVSRSYHEAVSRISEEYAKLFLYEGSKTDKHVREHEVFLVGDSEGAIAKIREGVAGRVASASQLGDTELLSKPSANRGIKIAAGAAIALIIALGVALALKKPPPPVQVVKDDPPKVVVAPVVPSTSAPTETKPPEVGTASDPKASEPAKPDQAGSKAGDVKGDGKTGVDVKPIDAKPADPKAVDPKAVDTKAADAAKAAEKRLPGKFDPKTQGQLIVSIRPWGNVIINGRQAGISPPNNQYALRPGKYEVRFTNSESFAPRVETIEVKVGETLRLSHEFK
jgi:PEGA domain